MTTFSLTLADIRSRVANGIGLDNTNGSVEQILIDSWTNEACLDVLERTKVKVEQANMTLTAGQGDYELPTGVLVMNQVVFTAASDGQVLVLEPLGPEEIIWRRRYVGAEPVRYYGMQGANLLMLYPVPQGADILNLYYVPVPGLLVNATDPLTNTGIPPQFQFLVELYVKARAGEYNNDGASQNGGAYEQRYQAEVRKARGRIRREQGRRRPPAVGGRRSHRRFFPTFPGQDTGA